MPPQSHNPTLESQAPAVLAELRAALARVLAASRVTIRRPRHVQTAFGIHQTLAWKIHRVALGPDLLADGQFIPGQAGFEAFLTSARERGLPADVLASAQKAFENYRWMVESQAGDRASLELMLRGMRSGVSSSAGEGRLTRKPGFRAASAIWGVQLRTRLLCQIVAPSTDAGRVDIAVIRGSIGMRRVRPDARLPIGPVAVLDNDGECRERGRIEALFPEDLTGGATLVRRYCSQPLPPTLIGRNPRGIPEYELGESPLGGKAGMTVYFAEVHRSAASAYRDAHNAFCNTALTARLPMESAVIDVWGHRSVFGAATPRTLYYGELSGVPWYEQSPEHAERLEMAERAHTIGEGLNAAPLPGVPEYPDLIREAFSRLRWNPGDFVLHRLVVKYPAVATAMVVQLDLPNAP